jgi:hypothetical protein
MISNGFKAKTNWPKEAVTWFDYRDHYIKSLIDINIINS